MIDDIVESVCENETDLRGGFIDLKFELVLRRTYFTLSELEAFYHLFGGRESGGYAC